MDFSVMEVRNGGLNVVLSDLSEWDINPGDSTKTACWYSTQRIILEKSETDSFYSYVLTNLDTATPDKARARKI